MWLKRLNLTTGPYRGVRKRSSVAWVSAVAGLDEAGRGPSPVQCRSCCVIAASVSRPPGLNDSKQIAESERNRLFAEIVHRATGVGLIGAAEAEIDRLEYSQSIPSCDASGRWTHFRSDRLLLLDAVVLPGLSISSACHHQGRRALCSITAAASIVAKGDAGPIDGLSITAGIPTIILRKHKGYRTPEHLHQLRTHGHSDSPPQLLSVQQVPPETGGRTPAGDSGLKRDSINGRRTTPGWGDEEGTGRGILA